MNEETERVARLIHDAFLAFHRGRSDVLPQWKPRVVPWDELPEVTRDGYRACAIAVIADWALSDRATGSSPPLFDVADGEG